MPDKKDVFPYLSFSRVMQEEGEKKEKKNKKQ